MKAIKTISPPILLFTLVLLINPAASAGVNITDAEAIYEVNLLSVSIPTQPYPVNNIFTLNAEAILKQNLSSVSIPTSPYPIKNIFIINEDAAFNKNLSTVSIPTAPSLIKQIFLINEDAIAQVSLASIVFVDIRNLAFNKSVITIPVNTTVTWINFDSVAHTVTPDDGSFNSGTLQTNQSFSHMFNVPGTFAYHCSIHPSMTGTVIVTSENIPPANNNTFDTSPGTYPSISGVHKGSITLTQTLTVHSLYTYPSPGTGGHSEYAAFYYPNGSLLAEANWSGYSGDWHNITLAPFALEAGITYNYTIRTGSYPLIIHSKSFSNIMGAINSTEFIDANGRRYTDWIPAIRME